MSTQEQTPKAVDAVYVSKMALKNGLPSESSNSNGRQGQDYDLAIIYGMAIGLYIGEDANSKPYTALVGQFEGRNIQEGTEEQGNVFRSSKLSLPSGIKRLLKSRFGGTWTAARNRMTETSM